MSRFSRLSRSLQDLFPSSDQSTPQPTDLSEVVQLVHQYPSQCEALDSATRQSFTSAAAVTPFLAPGFGGPAVQPQGTFDELIVGHVGHGFAGATRVRIQLVDPAGAAVIVATYSLPDPAASEGFWPIYMTGQGAAGFAWASGPPRSIIVPPGWNLQAAGQTQAVAYTITLAFVAVRRPIADLPLFR